MQRWSSRSAWKKKKSKMLIPFFFHMIDSIESLLIWIKKKENFSRSKRVRLHSNIRKYALLLIWKYPIHSYHQTLRHVLFLISQCKNKTPCQSFIQNSCCTKKRRSYFFHLALLVLYYYFSIVHCYKGRFELL